MRKIIIIAALAAIASPALAAPKGERAPRDTTTIKACGAEWKAAKADETVKAAGWPAFWSACAKRHKAERAA